MNNRVKIYHDDVRKNVLNVRLTHPDVILTAPDNIRITKSVSGKLSPRESQKIELVGDKKDRRIAIKNINRTGGQLFVIDITAGTALMPRSNGKSKVHEVLKRELSIRPVILTRVNQDFDGFTPINKINKKKNRSVDSLIGDLARKINNRRTK